MPNPDEKGNRVGGVPQTRRIWPVGPQFWQSPENPNNSQAVAVEVIAANLPVLNAAANEVAQSGRGLLRLLGSYGG